MVQYRMQNECDIAMLDGRFLNSEWQQRYGEVWYSPHFRLHHIGTILSRWRELIT